MADSCPGLTGGECTCSIGCGASSPGYFGGSGGTSRAFSGSSRCGYQITKIIGYTDANGDLLGIQIAHDGCEPVNHGGTSDLCTEFNIAQGDYITNVMVCTNSFHTQITGLLFTVASNNAHSYWLGNCNVSTSQWAVDRVDKTTNDYDHCLSWISGKATSSQLYSVEFNWINPITSYRPVAANPVKERTAVAAIPEKKKDEAQSLTSLIGIFGGSGGTVFSNSLLDNRITTIKGYTDANGDLIGVQITHDGHDPVIHGGTSDNCTEFWIHPGDYITNVMVSTNSVYTHITGLLFTVARYANSYWLGNCDVSTAAWAIDEKNDGNEYYLSWVSGSATSTQLCSVKFNWAELPPDSRTIAKPSKHWGWYLSPPPGVVPWRPRRPTRRPPVPAATGSTASTTTLPAAPVATSPAPKASKATSKRGRKKK